MSTEPPGPDTDARASNWRYVVPSQPAQPLVLDAGGAGIDSALSGQAWEAVVVTDLGAWVNRPGAKPTPMPTVKHLLEDLCAQVAPGGWMCVGFANPWYPAGPLARGSLALRTARRVLSKAGMTLEATYVGLPDHRHPALLVPAARPAELDHVLRRMLPTYVPRGVPLPRLSRRVMAILRAAAARTPQRLRLALLPGYLLLARRPS
jgi:hypothetical protein